MQPGSKGTSTGIGEIGEGIEEDVTVEETATETIEATGMTEIAETETGETGTETETIAKEMIVAAEAEAMIKRNPEREVNPTAIDLSLSLNRFFI